MRVEDFIDINAELHPTKRALVCGSDSLSYKELYDCVNSLSNEYKKFYAPLEIVSVRAFSNIDFVVKYFALHKAGCVVAPLDKDLPNDKFEQIVAKTKSSRVGQGSADILFTTGTTGTSKGVIISHEANMANAENLIESQGFNYDTAFVVCGPLNHIGSLSKIAPVIIKGGTLIIVDGIKDFNTLFKAFEYDSTKMATFLVPASIRMLLTFAPDRLRQIADRVDFIETGAAAISQGDMQTLCSIFPHSRLYNTYASTETGIIATHNYNGGVCVAGCLGSVMKNSKLFITPDGIIACSGKTIMSGYLDDKNLTDQILRDGVIYTKDIGKIDENALLHLIGREDDVINVGGFKVAPQEVENVAMGHPIVEDCICIAVDSSITGKALKLLVKTKSGESLDKRSLATYIRSQLESYKVPSIYEFVDKIERTFNGKLNRKFYTS